MSDALRDFGDEAYGEISALRYNIFESRPSGFAQQMAPKIWNFYQETGIGQDNNRVLDVGCGTGQLAAHFLAHGVQGSYTERQCHLTSAGPMEPYADPVDRRPGRGQNPCTSEV